MGGEIPDGTGPKPRPVPANPARAIQRKLALAQLIVGVPVTLVMVVGLVVGYRFIDRPLGGPIFWLILLTILMVFGVYFAQAFLLLRRSARE